MDNITKEINKVSLTGDRAHKKPVQSAEKSYSPTNNSAKMVFKQTEPDRGENYMLEQKGKWKKVGKNKPKQIKGDSNAEKNSGAEKNKANGQQERKGKKLPSEASSSQEEHVAGLLCHQAKPFPKNTNTKQCTKLSPHDSISSTNKDKVASTPSRRMLCHKAAVLPKCLKVVIIDERVLNIDAQQETILKQLITEKLGQAMFSGAAIPGFSRWKYRNGVVRIQCENEKTVRWLVDTVSNLKHPWKGSLLKVIRKEELEQYGGLKLFKIMKQNEASNKVLELPEVPETKQVRYNRSHIRVAIIDAQDPTCRIKTKQNDILMKILTDTYCDLFKDNNNVPRIGNWSYSGECIRLTCYDGQSLQWLNDTLSTLPPPWPGSRLQVIPSINLPKLVRAAILIKLENRDVEIVRTELADQNRWLRVKDWNLFYYTQSDVPKKTRIVFGIPESDAAEIESRGCKIVFRLYRKGFYGFPFPHRVWLTY